MTVIRPARPADVNQVLFKANIEALVEEAVDFPVSGAGEDLG